MANLKLSIIVPVYNVAPYLRKCVDSLLAQDYSDYEIILVDDGSTDNSGAICDEYVRENEIENERVSELERSPIRVIHQNNAGLSAARNTGIKAARGTYLCFVDSDDYWEPNVLGGLMAQIERDKLDVLRFDYQNVRIREDGQYEIFFPFRNRHVVDGRKGVIDGVAYLNERMGYNCYAVMFVAKRAIVPMFTIGIHFEDVDWLPRMMLMAKRVNGTSSIVYNYCTREGSITQENDDLKKRYRNVNDALIVIEHLKNHFTSHPQCRWIYNMISITTIAILNTVSVYFYNQRKHYILRLQQLEVFPLSLADLGGSYQFKARLCNISPCIGVFYLYVINKMLRFTKRNR